MYVVYTILGLIIGGFITGGGRYATMGAITGAVIGLVVARLQKLEQRIRSLESVERQRSATGSKEPASERAEPLAAKLHTDPDLWISKTGSAGSEEDLIASRTEPEKAAKVAWRYPPSHSRSTRTDLVGTLLKKATMWVTTGNIPVKVGVIISFIGVAFLLKYAVDRKIVVLSLEMRLVAVAIAGLAMLAIGWRLRNTARVYALSMQGGGTGVLFLTVFAALRLWQMLPAGLTFAMMVLLTAFTGTLAVLQNARSLAILGIIGGFLAPVLTSTGEGSHVALFSYYLILNAAILSIAWFRTWRELNLIGFGFTFIIGSLWGYQYYKPEFLLSTMPFLVLHFLFYQVIAIIYATRQSLPKLGAVDGTLVFGTPVIVFGLQAALVRDIEYGLAISAGIAALFYALVAVWLHRRKQSELRMLIESFTALAVAFATLMIPLALDARWTSATWALEGAALVWVGCRQNRHLANLAGASLIILSGLAFLDHGWQPIEGLPVINGNFIGCLIISISAFFASRKLDAAKPLRFIRAYGIASMILFVLGGLWWIGMGWQEIDDHVVKSHHAPMSLVFTSLSFLAGALLAHRWKWTLMFRACLVLLPFLGMMAAVYAGRHEHFLFGSSWIAWPLAWLIQVWVLHTLDENEEHVPGATRNTWHFLSVLLLSALLAVEAGWQAHQWLASAWAVTAHCMVPGILALLIWKFRFRPSWPVPVHPETYRFAGLTLVLIQISYIAVMSIARPGNPEPLPYFPVLNPFDLAMLFSLLTAWVSVSVFKQDTSEGIFGFPYLKPYQLFLNGAFFLLTTTALVRGVHHYNGVLWDTDSLFASVIVQTSLSVYWGLLGFTGMILGARRSSRSLWLTGAGLMALVVAKLFLVDLGNSGTVARIVSFIAIGGLLLVVGYFAPAPASGERQATDGVGPPE